MRGGVASIIIPAPPTGATHLGVVTVEPDRGNSKLVAGTGANCSVGYHELTLAFDGTFSYGNRALGLNEALCVVTSNNTNLRFSGTYLVK